MLTRRQRAIRHGLVNVLALALGAGLTMPLNALLGNDIEPEPLLRFVGLAALVIVVYAAITLFRGPRPVTDPGPVLTDQMRRRVR